MAIESCFLPEDYRSAVIVPLYKGKGEGIELMMGRCQNFS